MPEQIKPDYYKLQIDETKFDVFDLVAAIREKVPDFPFELESDLKYIIRIKKEDIDKRINDLEKSRECIDRAIQRLEKKKAKQLQK